ncbi:integrase, catalytic region, zinc finger, CCHC-type containing protein [Tanacetum coccineum]
MFVKGLTKELTNMKEVFTQMETELLISQDLVHIPVNSLAEIIDYKIMEKSFLDEYSEYVQLKDKLLKKNDMAEHAIYNELSKRCARMKNRCISLEIKIQQYKENFQNNQPQTKQDAPEFPVFFEINELKAHLQAKNNSINKLKDHIATLKVKGVYDYDKYENISKVIAPGIYKIDFKPHSPKLLKNREAHIDYLKHTKEHADALREIELLVYVSTTCPSSSKQGEKLIAVTPINKNKKVRFAEPRTSSRNILKQVNSCKTKDSNKPLLPSTGVINSTSASRSKPLGNLKKNRISRPTSSNKKNNVEDHPGSIKSSRNFTIDGNMCPLTMIISTIVVPSKKPLSSTVVNKTPPSSNTSRKLKDIANVIQIVLWYLDSRCSKHMIGQRSQLINFVSKLLGIVKFGNDQVAFRKHSCYVRDLEGVDLLTGSRGTYLYTLSIKDMMKSSPICLLSKTSKTKSWLRHQRLSHLNFSAINNLAKQGLVRVRLTVRNIRTNNGSEFVNQTLKAYYEDVGISHQTLVAHTPQQNSVVERQNWTLVEASRTMLIFSKALLFLWVEAVATTCYTQNRSLIRKRHNKTPYELLHDKKPDLTYFHVFGALCYPTNGAEDLGKLKLKDDIGIFIGYSLAKKAYRIYSQRTSFDHGNNPRLVHMPPSTTPYVPPTKNDWDMLFQPMFDEYFNPPPSVVSQVPAAAAPRPADPTGSPLSTSIDQDASSTSTSSTTREK